jgi:cytoskeletal protein RodZ
MNTIGEALRRERVRQGLDLQKLSETTKIGTRMLQAIETGDYAKLPGGVFTRSFIKQYAGALGVDLASIESELKQFQPEPEPVSKPNESHFTPFSSSDAPSNSLTASAIWVVLALFGCGAVYYFVRGHPPGSPTQPAAAVSAPAAGEETKAAPQPQPVEQSIPASKAAESPATGTLQVVLSASETSWVSISVDGKLAFSGILQPNDRREVNAEEKVKVVAGNAGGVDISLNGKNIEALGPKGQVRTVELTRAGAQVVSRTPKPLL